MCIIQWGQDMKFRKQHSEKEHTRSYLFVFLCTIQLMLISCDDIIDTPYVARSLVQHPDYQ